MDFADRWWVKLVCFTLLTVFTIPAKMHESKEGHAVLYPWLNSIYENHPALLFISDYVLIPAFIISLGLEELRKALDRIQVDPVTLLSLLNRLATAVGQKNCARHHKAAVLCGAVENSDPIHRSTPKDQIDCLLDGAWLLFQREAERRGMSNNEQIKVTLAKMDEGCHFSGFWYYLPKDSIPSSDANLRDQPSAFSRAAQSGQVFILDDIAKELKRPNGEQNYAPSESPEDNEGCIICFPIKIQKLNGHPSVPLVVAIKCNIPKIFTKRQKSRYIALGRHFVDRITLEYYNFVIAEKQHERA